MSGPYKNSTSTWSSISTPKSASSRIRTLLTSRPVVFGPSTSLRFKMLPPTPIPSSPDQFFVHSAATARWERQTSIRSWSTRPRDYTSALHRSCSCLSHCPHTVVTNPFRPSSTRAPCLAAHVAFVNTIALVHETQYAQRWLQTSSCSCPGVSTPSQRNVLQKLFICPSQSVRLHSSVLVMLVSRWVIRCAR